MTMSRTLFSLLLGALYAAYIFAKVFSCFSMDPLVNYIYVGILSTSPIPFFYRFSLVLRVFSPSFCSILLLFSNKIGVERGIPEFGDYFLSPCSRDSSKFPPACFGETREEKGGIWMRKQVEWHSKVVEETPCTTFCRFMVTWLTCPFFTISFLPLLLFPCWALCVCVEHLKTKIKSGSISPAF